jgi:hypothetical protein
MGLVAWIRITYSIGNVLIQGQYRRFLKIPKSQAENTGLLGILLLDNTSIIWL